jgi:hypothetical protein
MKYIDKILASFENSPGGFSARKLTAFALILFAAYTHRTHMTDENSFAFLCVDVAGALISLGIITMQEIIKLKNGNDIPRQDNS